MNAPIKNHDIDTVIVNGYKIPLLVELFKRFENTAAKLNLSKPTFTAIPAKDRIEINEFGVEHIISQCSVSFFLPKLKLGGYQFIGSKEIGEGASMAVVRTAPGHAVEARFWDATDHCEHCNKNRNRKSLFLLQDDSGRQLQVGSGCLADFLGHHEAEKIANLLADFVAVVDGVEDDDYDSFGGERHGLGCTFGTALRTAVALVDIRGFSPASNANGSIKSLMTTAIFGKYEDQTKVWTEMRSSKLTTDQIEDRALAISCWALDLKGDNEIERNMKALAGQTGVKSKDFGFIAAMIPAYNKATVVSQKFAERQKELATIAPFAGTPGEKITVRILVTRESSANSYYGGVPKTTFIYTMVGNGHDENLGRTFVWFSSTGLLREGDDVTISGKIKEETEFRGEKQVRLTHCKIVPTR